MLVTNFPALLALLGQITLALSELELIGRDDDLCGPTSATMTYINTVTVPAIVTRSCYTETITTRHHGTGCPNLSTCGPHIECVLFSTETVIVPPSDPCCPATPTIAVQGPCPTCQKGCLTNTVTQYLTQDTSFLAKKDVTSKSCTKTVFASGPTATGPTKTMYTLTSTSIVSVSCGGCLLLTSNVGGLGPAVTFTTTVTRSTPTTTTAWVCL